MVTKLKNSRTQIVTKRKMGQNSNCKKKKKNLKNLKYDKIQIVTKLENSNYDKNSKFEKTQKLKLCHKPKL